MNMNKMIMKIRIIVTYTRNFSSVVKAKTKIPHKILIIHTSLKAAKTNKYHLSQKNKIIKINKP